MAGTTALAVATATALALAVTPVTDAAVRAEVDRVIVQVSAARRLPFRGKLQARAVSRDAAEAQTAAALAARIGELGAEERILKRLGLLATAADYTKLFAAGPTATPIAAYDPSTQRLLVPDFVPLESQRVALIHEVAHAVADQRFDLREFLTPPPPSPLEGDATRARLALAEGDATQTAMEVIDPTAAFLRPTALAAIADRLRAAAGDGHPPWLAALTRFVHVDGFLFVARVRATQPWSAVDALWRDPPDSTEQILHADKYEACEAPIAVPDSALPALPGFDRPRETDVLGELVLRAWLSTALPDDVAARAAAGWGGDRAGIYPSAATTTVRPDGGAPMRVGERGVSPREPFAGGPGPSQGPGEKVLQQPLVWLTIWDDAGEADEFLRAASAVAGPDAVSRRAEAVALFLGPPDLAQAALEGALDGWKTSRQASTRRGAHPRRAAPSGCPRRDRAAAPR